MGDAVELKDGKRLTFRNPVPAFRNYTPGQSPYVHRWLDLNNALPMGEHHLSDAPLSTQTFAALGALVQSALHEAIPVGETSGSGARAE